MNTQNEQLTVIFYTRELKPLSFNRYETVRHEIRTEKNTIPEAFQVAVEYGADPTKLIKYTLQS